MNDKNKSQTSYDKPEMQEFEKTDFSDNADLLSKPSKKNHKIIITSIIMFLVGIAVGFTGVYVINNINQLFQTSPTFSKNSNIKVISNYSFDKYTQTLIIFSDWTNEQTINIQGRSATPDTWDKYWNGGCYAKIVWDA